MSKNNFSLLCDTVSYLFYNSASRALELGHRGTKSIPVTEVVVVRPD